jgi:hypothetical protein
MRGVRFIQGMLAGGCIILKLVLIVIVRETRHKLLIVEILGASVPPAAHITSDVCIVLLAEMETEIES